MNAIRNITCIVIPVSSEDIQGGAAYDNCGFGSTSSWICSDSSRRSALSSRWRGHRCLRMGHFSLMTGYGQEKKMISIGIDTHERMHYVEAQNERQQVMWHGSISNNREGFFNLIEKIRSLCRSNSQEVIGIFMNPTGNYHLPLKYFLEARGNKVFLIDSRKTFHLRQIMNFGTLSLPIYNTTIQWKSFPGVPSALLLTQQQNVIRLCKQPPLCLI